MRTQQAHAYMPATFPATSFYSWPCSVFQPSGVVSCAQPNYQCACGLSPTNTTTSYITWGLNGEGTMLNSTTLPAAPRWPNASNPAQSISCLPNIAVINSSGIHVYSGGYVQNGRHTLAGESLYYYIVLELRGV